MTYPHRRHPCRRGEIDRPISIRALKRFLTEQYGPESKHPINVNEGRGQKKLPYKIAVVGGGPVGLSAAHDLALMGYPVTIFEAAPVAGTGPSGVGPLGSGLVAMNRAPAETSRMARVTRSKL